MIRNAPAAAANGGGGENGEGPPLPASDVKIKSQFLRDAFVNIPDTTGGKTEGMPKSENTPENKKYVEFGEDTRKDFETFLTHYANNILEAKRSPGWKDKLKAQPQAEQALQLLGIDDLEPGSADREAKLQKGIDSLLTKSDGWMWTKTLIDHQTELQNSVAGFAIASLPPAERDIVGQALEGIYRRVYTGEGQGVVNKLGITARREINRHWSTIQKALGTTGGSALVGTGTALAVGAGPGAIAASALALASYGGYEIYKSARRPGETVTRTASADRLLSIKNNPQLAEYVKMTLGADVNDFDIRDGQVVAVNQKSTQQINAMLYGAMSNSFSIKKYYRDLGIPPSEQDINPEQGLLADTPQRTGERSAKMLQEKFDALGGRESLANQNANADVLNFMDQEAWRRKQRVPTEADLGLDRARYDQRQLRPRADAEDHNGVRRGQSDLLDTFFGKLPQGTDLAQRLQNAPYNEGNMAANGTITVAPNSPDQWGQRPGHAGYGVEKREARRIFGRVGPERTERIRTTGNNIPDRLGNTSEHSIGFARTDGREIKIPDRPNPNAIAWKFDEETRKLVDFNEVVSWVDADGNSHQIRNRRDIWDQDEYIDIGRRAFEDRLRGHGINPENINLNRVLAYADLQRQLNFLGIADDQVESLTHDSLIAAINKVQKHPGDISVDRLLALAHNREQMTALGLDSDALRRINSDELTRRIEDYQRRQAVPANNLDEIDFTPQSMLAYGENLRLLNDFDRQGITHQEVLEAVPELAKNRFFAILDTKNLQDTAGNPITVSDEAMLVNEDPADARDTWDQPPDSLFYKVFDGRQIQVPPGDDRNRKRTYKRVWSRGRVVGYDVVYNNNEDIWGQKLPRRGRESNDRDYVFAFNAKLLGPYNPYQNVDQQYLADLDNQGYYAPNPELGDIDPAAMDLVAVKEMHEAGQLLTAAVGRGINEQAIVGFIDDDAFRAELTARGLVLPAADIARVRTLARNNRNLRILAARGITEQAMQGFDIVSFTNAVNAAGLTAANINAAQFLTFVHTRAELADVRRTGISEGDIATLDPAELRTRIRDRQQQRDAYFARRENTETGRFGADHFDKQYWRDQFDQPYYLPNGERNWFFGRGERTALIGQINATLPPDQQLPTGLGDLEARQIDTNNFDIEDLEDSIGRIFPNENFGRGDRPFARRFRGGPRNQLRTAQGETVNTSREYFQVPVELQSRDGHGRQENDPRFGLTDTQIREALRDYGTTASPAEQAAIASLLGGTRITNDATLAPNYALFNRQTGQDIFGQDPWNPMFCVAPSRIFINVDRTVDGFRGANAQDLNGRHEGDPGFGTGASAETMTAVPETTDHIRVAREAVLSDLAEWMLAPKLEANPTGGKVIELEKRRKAREKGGEKHTKSTAEAAHLRTDQTFLEGEEKKFEEYEEAIKARKEAPEELEKYIKEVFNATLNDTDAIDRVKETLEGTHPITLTINGAKKEIKAIKKRRKDLNDDYDDKKERLEQALKRQPLGEGESWEGRRKSARWKEDFDTLDREYLEELGKINEDDTILRSIQTDIENYQTARDEEIAEDVSEATDKVFEEREKDLKYLTDPQPGGLGLTHDQIRGKTILEVAKLINPIYDTTGRTLGWPEVGNDHAPNRRRILNAQAELLAQQINPAVDINNAALEFRNMVDLYNVNEHQLRLLTEDEIIDRANWPGGTPDAEKQRVAERAKREAEARFNARKEATKMLTADTTYQVKILESDKPSLELKQQNDKLIPVEYMMKHRGEAYARRKELIGSPGTFLPTRESQIGGTTDQLTHIEGLRAAAGGVPEIIELADNELQALLLLNNDTVSDFNVQEIRNLSLLNSLRTAGHSNADIADTDLEDVDLQGWITAAGGNHALFNLATIRRLADTQWTGEAAMRTVKFSELNSTERDQYTPAEQKYAADHNLDVGFFGMLQLLSGYQNYEDLSKREEFFNQLTKVMTPEFMYQVLSNNNEIGIAGGTLSSVLANFARSIVGAGLRPDQRAVVRRIDDRVVPMGYREVRLLMKDLIEKAGGKVLAEVA